MKYRTLLTGILLSLVSTTLLFPAYVSADFRQGNQNDRRADNRKDNQNDRRADKRKNNQKDRRADKRKDNQKDRRADKRKDKQKDRRADKRKDKRRHEVRRGNRLIVVTPRRRSFRNIVVVRTHGHAYHGYGHSQHDNDAWKWLAFTAITLKVLDMVDEQAQREHEAAQVKATTAAVGEKIVWESGDSSGYVVTTKKGTNSSGLTCREFQQNITVGGKTENAYGTACLQADGSWKVTP